MSSIGAAPRAAPISNARAEASRRNGARSRGPKTPEGKARASRNALKHGLRAQKHIVLPEENAAAFRTLEAALIRELAPEGALQSVLVRRIAAAAWRLERAERIEGEIFEIEGDAPIRNWGRLGLALVRAGNGTRSFETLLRYRGAALAELWRALRTLKTLQAVPEATRRPAAPTRPLPVEPKAARRRPIQAADRQAGEPPHPAPIEPESPGEPGHSEPAPPATEPRRPGRAPSKPGRQATLPATALQRAPRANEPGQRAADGRADGPTRATTAPPRIRLDQLECADGRPEAGWNRDAEPVPPRAVSMPEASSGGPGCQEISCRLRR